MKRAKNIIVLLILMMSMLFGTVSINGYKDHTHQKLTQRALQVAADNASAQGVPSSLVRLFVNPDGSMNNKGYQCINGAGQHKKGEDYTKYWVKGSGCKLRVHVHRSWFEPLNHFHDGMLWGKPALLTAADACGVMGRWGVGEMGGKTVMDGPS